MVKEIKNISLVFLILVCLIFGMKNISHSDQLAEKQRIYLEKHVEKVRIEKPKEYQEMVEKAGTIVNCLSCHEEEFMKEDPQ
jgi:hypothetical protein